MKLEIEITRKDFLNFNVDHFLRTQLTNTIVISLAGLLALQLFIHHNRTVSDTKLVLLSSLLYFIAYFLWVYYTLNRSKDVPQNNGTILGLKTWEFNDDGITYADKHSQGHYNWDVVNSFKESKRAFYLYVDRHVAIVVPKRVFNSSAVKKEFVELVNKNILKEQDLIG